MSTKISRRLVIDASVARASGGAEATYPTSKHCRDFLQAVLTICHHMVLTPDIAVEWKTHRSKFARTWQTAMMARKKVVRVEVAMPSILLAKIKAVAASDKDSAAMFKDLCLIAAALATDQTVISLDETVRQLFRQAAASVGELRSVVWVNPDQVAEQSIIWLENGAKPDKERRLSN